MLKPPFRLASPSVAPSTYGLPPCCKETDEVDEDDGPADSRRARLERQQQRSQETASEHARTVAQLQEELAALHGRCAAAQASLPVPADDRLNEAQCVALQTERREQAEHAAASALAEAEQLRELLAHQRQYVGTLECELAAAETQLRDMADDASTAVSTLGGQLRGRRILYVGGRPGAAAAIRALVQRHDGEFQRHDGGIEDRKGLLPAYVAAADLVVFPVDCVDHDSAGNLKRHCTRLGIPFVALRSAGVASFVAALSNRSSGREAGVAPRPPICLKHG